MGFFPGFITGFFPQKYLCDNVILYIYIETMNFATYDYAYIVALHCYTLLYTKGTYK